MIRIVAVFEAALKLAFPGYEASTVKVPTPTGGVASCVPPVSVPAK